MKRKKRVKPKVKGKTKKVRRNGQVSPIISFPAKLVAPVGNLLRRKLKDLEKRKKVVEEEDPFQDTTRIIDNASPDTDAAEQFGHARSSAIREQIDRRIIETRKALTRIKIGKYGICEECGQMIDTDRLMIYPEATLCARDARKKEK